jgi:hemerythrin-like domain-containing protein
MVAAGSHRLGQMNGIRTGGGSPAGKWQGRPGGLVALAASAHEEMLRLCALLEEVADGLPDRCERMTCLMVASQLEPLMRGVHRFEEEALFPAYSGALKEAGRGLNSLERLMSEHVEDECFAAELTEALLELGRGGRPDNPEALGFMLRGFFESKRRHIAFEREHVLPMIEGRL